MKKLIFSLICGAVLASCSANAINMAVDAGAPYVVGPMVQDMIDQAFEQGDVEMVHLGVPTAIVAIEGLLRRMPKDRQILAQLSLLYFAYSFAFVEEVDLPWANKLYLRGKKFGLESLKLNRDFAAAIAGERIDWRAAVATLGEEDLPALFWTAINIGMYVNANKRDPAALFEIGAVLAMMDRVIELDDTFFYGGAYLFYGAYYAGLPAMAGGGAEKAKAAFDEAAEIGEGKFLLIDLFYARYYAPLLRDEVIYDATLKKIIEAPDDILPAMSLITSVAKSRAKKMIEYREGYLYGGAR